jgi:hypothetical protein
MVGCRLSTPMASSDSEPAAVQDDQFGQAHRVCFVALLLLTSSRVLMCPYRESKSIVAERFGGKAKECRDMLVCIPLTLDRLRIVKFCPCS